MYICSLHTRDVAFGGKDGGNGKFCAHISIIAISCCTDDESENPHEGTRGIEKETGDRLPTYALRVRVKAKDVDSSTSTTGTSQKIQFDWIMTSHLAIR